MKAHAPRDDLQSAKPATVDTTTCKHARPLLDDALATTPADARLLLDDAMATNCASIKEYDDRLISFGATAVPNRFTYVNESQATCRLDGQAFLSCHS
ncbi:MAG: hypothetical protein ACK55I_37380, partial [bacterium]